MGMNPDVDRISFADSDQFDEDSVNSWLSDSEDQINNWRGWKKTYISSSTQNFTHIDKKLNQPEKLLKQAAKVVAAIQPGFDLTERGIPFPEELIKLIAFDSFPAKEEEIRLYSCLGCGNIDEFIRGENLYKTKAVKECLQIGFHLSAKVLRRPQAQDAATETQPVQYEQGFNYTPYFNSNNEFNIPSSGTALPPHGNGASATAATDSQLNKHLSLNHPVICKVGITFDRGRITSCHCSCYQEFVDPAWCCHVVAACLYRIHEASTVKIRAPISESLSKLTKEDLQKFSQFLISKMTPADILPAAQNILDELLASSINPLKSVRGAPDLTAGASFEDKPNWYFDQVYIQENISKILQKFCVPKPVVYGDPRHLSNNLPIVAQEYQNILRPMRGKEPEGIWNLISIIRDMFRREDSNALSMLRILTRCLLDSKPIIMWWYCIKLNQDWCLRPASGNGQSSANGGGSSGSSNGGGSLHSQYASGYFCDEMVELWRLAALRHGLSTCQFLTSRRLDTHDPPHIGGTVSPQRQLHQLAAEIARLHRFVIRTAILCLDKQPSSVLTSLPFSVPVYQPPQPTPMVSSSSVRGRHASIAAAAAAAAHNSTVLTLLSEEAQRHFSGFKPALDTCRLCIELHKREASRVAASATMMTQFDRPLLLGGGSVERGESDSMPSSPSQQQGGGGVATSDSGDDSERAGTASGGMSILKTNDDCIADNDEDNDEHQSDTAAGAIRILPVSEFLEYSTTSSVTAAASAASSGVDAAPPQMPASTGSGISNNLSRKEFKKNDLKYVQCEALFYNGYPNESAQLAYELAEHLLDKKWSMYDRMYREARTCLLESHQRLSGGCVPRKEAGGSLPNTVGTTASAASKTARRYRNSGTTSSQYQVPGTRNLEQMADIEQTYQAKTLMRRIQFLIHCLVSDSVNLSRITPSHRLFMPTKSRLVQLAFQLLIMALQMPRAPAPHKQLEVLMLQLEIDIVVLAQQIKWADHIDDYRAQLEQIAHELKHKTLPYLTEIHIPYNLVSFVFEQLTAISCSGAGSSFCGAENGVAQPNSRMLAMMTRQRLYSSRADRNRARLAAHAEPATVSCTENCNYDNSSFDNNLGFESALSVLSMKTKITEAINPLLVEGQRRLRDEFSAFLLNVYKDDVDKLTLILKQLLDPSLNPHFKAAPLSFYLTNPLSKMLEALDTSPDYPQAPSQHQQYIQQMAPDVPVMAVPNTEYGYHYGAKLVQEPLPVAILSPLKTVSDPLPVEPEVGVLTLPPPLATILTGTLGSSGGGRHTKSRASLGVENKTSSSVDTDSSALEDDNSETSISERKQWEQKLRCFTSTKRAAAIDSSAPETTESSDNSPTTIRKRILPSTAASGGGHNSLLYSVTVNGGPCGGDKPDMEPPRVEEEPQPIEQSPQQPEESHTRPAPPLPPVPLPPAAPVTAIPFLLDQNSLSHVTETVTESLAHHMFELAQTVLQKAGIPDDSCTPVFRVVPGSSGTTATTSGGTTAPAAVTTAAAGNAGPGSTSNTNGHATNNSGGGGNGGNSSVPGQRHLQLCAFQLGLYALGLYNQLNPLWQSRTYSSHVAWISTQIVEAAGAGAACVLLHSWRHHLTPSEVAETAFRLSRRRLLSDGGGGGSGNSAPSGQSSGGSGSSTGRAGAELCLAVLAEGCSALNPSQIVRGLRQCGDQSAEMLERGLVAVERGANSSLSGVQPVIYFHLAQAWFQLYKSEAATASAAAATAAAAAAAASVASVGSSSSSSSSSGHHSGASSTTSAGMQPVAVTSTSHAVGHIPSLMVVTAPYQPSTSMSLVNSYHHSSMMPAIPQMMGGMMISPKSQIPSAAAYPGSPYVQSLQAAAVASSIAPAWLYSNMMAGGSPMGHSSHQSRIGPQQQLLLNSYHHHPYHHQQQQQHHQMAALLQFQQFPAVRPPPPPASLYSGSSPMMMNMLPGYTSATGPLASADNSRTHEYLVRSFNSAMRAIHILFQLHNSSSSSSGAVDGGVGGGGPTVGGAGGGGSGGPRRQQYKHNSHSHHHAGTAAAGTAGGHNLLFSGGGGGGGSDLPTSGVDPSSADCQSHDSNIRWTFNIARLLGADEVNRYCHVVLQFIQSPFLMKDIVQEVMEFFQLSHSAILSSQSAPDPQQQQQQQASSVVMPTTVCNPAAAAAAYAATFNSMFGGRNPFHHQHMHHIQSQATIPSSVGAGGASVTGLSKQQQQTHPGMMRPSYQVSISPQTQPNPVMQQSQQQQQTQTTIVNHPTQTGMDLVYKMINRLHYLFRRMIEKRLQQTGQGMRDWDSLVELILQAYRAQRQLPAPDPNLGWCEVLQKIKTNRKCTKDLWARICTGLQTADQI